MRPNAIFAMFNNPILKRAKQLAPFKASDAGKAQPGSTVIIIFLIRRQEADRPDWNKLFTGHASADNLQT